MWCASRAARWRLPASRRPSIPSKQAWQPSLLCLGTKMFAVRHQSPFLARVAPSRIGQRHVCIGILRRWAAQGNSITTREISRQCLWSRARQCLNHDSLVSINTGDSLTGGNEMMKYVEDRWVEASGGLIFLGFCSYASTALCCSLPTSMQCRPTVRWTSHFVYNNSMLCVSGERHEPQTSHP